MLKTVVDEDLSSGKFDLATNGCLQQKTAFRPDQMSDISSDSKCTKINEISKLKRKSKTNDLSEIEEDSEMNVTLKLEKNSEHKEISGGMESDFNTTMNLENKSNYKKYVDNKTDSNGTLKTPTNETLVVGENTFKKVCAVNQFVESPFFDSLDDGIIINILKNQIISLYKEMANYKEKECVNFYYYDSEENLPKLRQWLRKLKQLNISVCAKTFQYRDKFYSNVLLNNLM